MNVRRYYNRFSLVLYALWLVFLAAEPFVGRTTFGPAIQQEFSSGHGWVLALVLPLGLYFSILLVGTTLAWLFRLLTGRR